MRPTVDDQLRGARRAIDACAENPTVGAEVAGALREASRVLRRVEGSWAALLPFLTADNHATAALLAEVARCVPEPIAGRAQDAAVARPDTGCDPLDVVAVNERNEALRALLAEVVAALPAGPQGDAARVRILDHLRRRLDTDPTSGRARGRGASP